MKITKYPQSCFVVEQDGRRLLIDPGMFVASKYAPTDFGPIDAVLLTHEHPDHADRGFIEQLVADQRVPVYANESTKQLLGNVVTHVVADGDSFEVAGFSIAARELPHMLLADGSPGPQNTGYIINGVFFDPGDGLEIENLKIQNAAVPIAGPSASPRAVVSFVKQIGATKVVPVHYDYFPSDPEFMKRLIENIVPGTQCIALADGESTEL